MRQFFRILFPLMMLLLVWPAAVSYGHAEGGVLQLAYQPVGPYYVHVWTHPAVLRAGMIHFEALITDAEGAPVTGCDIALRVTPIDMHGQPNPGDSVLTAAGPALETQEFHHQADVLIEAPGRYQVDILVDEAAVRIGSASFDLIATGVAAWATFSIYALGALSVLFGLWLLRQGARLFLGGFSGPSVMQR